MLPDDSLHADNSKFTFRTKCVDRKWLAAQFGRQGVDLENDRANDNPWTASRRTSIKSHTRNYFFSPISAKKVKHTLLFLTQCPARAIFLRNFQYKTERADAAQFYRRKKYLTLTKNALAFSFM
jgi:hypothetical protein